MSSRTANRHRDNMRGLIHRVIAVLACFFLIHPLQSAKAEHSALGGVFFDEWYWGDEGGTITISVYRPGIVSPPPTFSTTLTIVNQAYGVTGVPDSITWPAGDTAIRQFSISLPNDALAGNDDYLGQIEALSGTHKVGITGIIARDNDATVQFERPAFNVNEDAGFATITVTRAGGTIGALFVDYTVTAGTATDGEDYRGGGGTLVWENGDSMPKTISVPVIADSVSETNETVSLNLTALKSGTGADVVSFGNQTTAVLTISDVTRSMLDFAATELSGDEGANVLVTVTRSGGTGGAISVNYVTTDISATANSDYEPVNGTLNWAVGESGAKSFTVNLLNDQFTETIETLRLTLSNPVGDAVLGAGSSATLTINANAYIENTPPVATDATFTLAQGQAFEVILDDAEIAWDVDTNDYLHVSRIPVPPQHINGQVSTEGTWIYYVPESDFSGHDSFVYEVTDSNGATATGTIYINIGGNNAQPQALDLQQAGKTDQPVLIKLLGAVSDKDGDSLTISAPAKTAHGSTSVSGLVITYQPDPGFAGEDSFDYTVTDGFGGVATATITLRIAGVIPLATALNIQLQGGDVQLARLNSAVQLSVQVSDEANTPVPGVAMQWSAVEQPNGQPVALTAEENATDESGVARATLPTSSTPTTYAVTVTATLPDTEISASATFTIATGLQAITLPNTPEGALAGALDAFCPQLAALGEALTAQEQALVDRCNEIFGAATDDNDAQILHALRKLAPEETAAQGRIGNSVSTQQVGNIASRLAALRSGARGATLSGLAFNIKGQTVPGTVLAELLGPDARGGGASADPVVGTKWGAFVSGTVGGGDKDRTDREEGFNFETLGLTVGADYRFTNAFVMGAALGYADTAVDLDNDGGDLDAGGISLSLYGTWYQSERLYFDAVLNYGSNNYDMTRNVDYTVGTATVQKTARADTDSDLLALSLGGGYEVATRSGITAEASVRFTYVDSTIDGYSESGADELNLTLKDQSIDVLTSSLGGRLSWPFSMKWGVLIPQFNLSWEHEIDDGAHQIKGHFVADRFQTTFAFDTDEPDHDYFSLGLGASAIWPGGSTGFLQYQTTLGRDDFRDYNIAFGARVELPW